MVRSHAWAALAAGYCLAGQSRLCGKKIEATAICHDCTTLRLELVIRSSVERKWVVLYICLLGAALLLGPIGVILSAIVRARGGTPLQSERLVTFSSVVLNVPIAASIGFALA